MKKVVASLQYGYLARESYAVKFFIILTTALFCFICAITICIVSCILGGEIILEDGELSTTIGMIVGINILGAVLFIVSVCILINEKHIRKLIESWQDDFAETTATVIDESIPVMKGKCFGYQIKLVVKFKINGKKYKKKSEFKQHKLSIFTCYGQMRNLVGDDVPIYYSKKNDQVVFIKWN